MKKYYYCIYRGSIGPQTSFLVPIEEKEKYKLQISGFCPIIQEFEIEI